ncbi:CdaR family protein [Solibacillus sp. FSL H8-0538]|uniref:CdaR family protein n=1 Tax=Solibacillus sp. FSL H8-0538 TaxID=2921400 RepID=UPI0030FA5DD7
MDKLFDSYWVLRITALVLSVLLFFYVQSENNTGKDTPSSTETDIITNVPLEVYYDDENLLVTGLPETVDVKISGPMQIVVQTKLLEDYKVFVDLNSLLIGEHRVTIQQENFSGKLDVVIDPETVNVVIEEKVAKEFRVDPEMNHLLIGDDYILRGMTIEPSKVLITGAKSVIESISYVKATVKADAGINASFQQEANVKVLDRDLNKLGVTIYPEKVNVKVEINEYGRELPITIKQTGELAEGVTINELSTKPSTIIVYGPKSKIDALTEVVVDVDVSKIKESGSYEMGITLPAGAAKLSQEKITVQADVTKTTTEVEARESEAVNAEETVNEEN